MVRAQIFRRGLASSRLIEHPAQPHAINGAAMHTEAHNATRALIHHNQNPVCAQDGRFASKQIETPQTVLRVTENREPGRLTRVWCRLVPNGEDATHHVLIDGNAEGEGDLLSDPWTTPSRIPPFHVDDGGDDFRRRSFWTRLRRHLGRKEPPIFPLGQGPMKAQQRGGFGTIAERISRLGRMRSAHRPVTTRSESRRVGDRLRARLRISSWCLTSTDSATTERAPPGPASRATVARRWRKRTARSRTTPA